MSDLRINGIPVGYRVSGEGPTVLYLHAGGGSGGQWRGVIEAMDLECRNVTVDFHGAGKTGPWPGVPENHTHEAEAALVMGVLDHLDPMDSQEPRGPSPVHLVGHSYGGGVALRMAVLAPHRVQSLVLIEPIANSLLDETGDPLVEMHRGYARAFITLVAQGEPERAWREFIDVNNGQGAWVAMPGEAREKMLAMTDSAVSGYHANLNHGTTLAECRAIPHPTLLMHGENASPEFRRMSEVLAAVIPAASLRVLPGAGHMSPLTHPGLVASFVSVHLRSVSDEWN